MESPPLGCFKLFLLLGGTVFSMLILGLLVLVGQRSYEYNYGFDQERWLATGQQLGRNHGDEGLQGNPRESMVADVMAHHLRVGMTRVQVLAVLGPAERDGIEWCVPADVGLPDSLMPARLSNDKLKRFNDWYAQHAQPDTLMRYWVGWDVIDPTSMRIEFNGKGQVKKYWVGLH
ncbi:hypothetical protein MUN81_13050 [Hymenobacter sp. 5317J-9]|uniref:hypothetical protein n=1 Tax=Hymenobacter sp. 5317J-9 TaxID=2932250 RepID=UPI001FD721CB|nr:hypothetical protein [Hymenobacter sp. 5317J-9]UOQ96182.1 hypothetical protein MUN81_13050 [Hymenobacter sp. 5317J-9]